MGKHIGEAPLLVCHLVGIAITTQAANVLEQVLAHPRTPNLYWGLATLPRPFIDGRKAFEGERLAIYGAFPGILELATNPEAGPLPPEKLSKLNRFLSGVGPDFLPRFARRFLLADRIRVRHEAAKKALIAGGRSADKVQQWPHIQVALMDSLAEYDRLLDEIVKRQAQPYWETGPFLERAERMLKPTALSSIRGPSAPALALAPLLLPAVSKVSLARAQVDRQLAALQCLEAIRGFAAAHKGQLPATLAEIKDAPLPVCAVTGQPFTYRRTGESNRHPDGAASTEMGAVDQTVELRTDHASLNAFQITHAAVPECGCDKSRAGSVSDGLLLNQNPSLSLPARGSGLLACTPIK